MSSTYEISSPRNGRQINAVVRSQDPIIAISDTCDDFYSSILTNGAESPSMIKVQERSPTDGCIPATVEVANVQPSTGTPTFQKRGRFLVWPASLGPEHDATIASRT
jgi:hypothetical protein